LFESESVKDMTNNFDKYYAKDKLHLSGEGYGVWFNEIEKEIDLVE
jgi:lysophospholipase L1-like esterase